MSVVTDSLVFASVVKTNYQRSYQVSRTDGHGPRTSCGPDVTSPVPSRPVPPYSVGGQGRVGPRLRSTGDERGRAVALSPFFLRCLWRFTTHRLSHRRDFSAPAVYKETTLLNFCAVVHSGPLWEDSSDLSGNGLLSILNALTEMLESVSLFLWLSPTHAGE